MSTNERTTIQLDFVKAYIQARARHTLLPRNRWFNACHYARARGRHKSHWEQALERLVNCR